MCVAGIDKERCLNIMVEPKLNLSNHQNVVVIFTSLVTKDLITEYTPGPKVDFLIKLSDCILILKFHNFDF